VQFGDIPQLFTQGQGKPYLIVIISDCASLVKTNLMEVFLLKTMTDENMPETIKEVADNV